MNAFTRAGEVIEERQAEAVALGAEIRDLLAELDRESEPEELDKVLSKLAETLDLVTPWWEEAADEA